MFLFLKSGSLNGDSFSDSCTPSVTRQEIPADGQCVTKEPTIVVVFRPYRALSFDCIKPKATLRFALGLSCGGLSGLVP